MIVIGLSLSMQRIYLTQNWQFGSFFLLILLRLRFSSSTFFSCWVGLTIADQKEFLEATRTKKKIPQKQKETWSPGLAPCLEINSPKSITENGFGYYGKANTSGREVR